MPTLRRPALLLTAILVLLVGCGAPAGEPTAVPSTATARPNPTAVPATVPAAPAGTAGLSEEEAATLSSLQQVDDYPLYTMRYYGSLERAGSLQDRGTGQIPGTISPPPWACSLFTTLADPQNKLYGRNFDWEYSPALLLFTDPPDGYASVSMVDIAFLVDETQARALPDLPLAERSALLEAPFWPFDGMNEHGLVVGMAAVPESRMPDDPGKTTVDSLLMIRILLDHARDVDEAVALLQQYNIDWAGGPALHYLIADASGHAVLVEFYEGEMILLPNERPWHLATNHLRTIADAASSGCRRYDDLEESLTETDGRVSAAGAMDLLEQVSQKGTQWSVVYGISTGDVYLAIGQKYEHPYSFSLELAR